MRMGAQRDATALIVPGLRLTLAKSTGRFVTSGLWNVAHNNPSTVMML